MTVGPRFDVRPRQRGRDGLPGLEAFNPPKFEDVMIDRIKVGVSGAFGNPASSEDAGRLFDRYKYLLLDRAADPASNWKAPSGRSRSATRAELKPDPNTTISKGVINIRWARDAVTIRLNLTLNPTRTLSHRLAEIGDSPDPIGLLASLTPNEFFATSNSLQQLQTLDGNDNMIANWSVARSKLGSDFPTLFLEVFEAQLQRWVADAVAPESVGFSSRVTSDSIVAVEGMDRLQLFWDHMTILSAEAYFERRHASAVDLLDRLTRDIPAGHTASEWRRYGQNEIGERRQGTEVIGIDVTNTVQQKYYAKTSNRIRIETTYTRAIRNAVRLNLNGTVRDGFFELSSALRRDTVTRCKWDAFCNLCAVPRRATLQEAAQLFTTVSVTAHDMDVDPTPVLAALLSTGGVDATLPNGLAPSKLLEKLERLGVLKRKNLRRRNQPKAPVRYRLNSDWLEVADRIQKAFSKENHA